MVDKTGATSRRALVRLFDGDDKVLAGGVGVTSTALSILGHGDPAVEAVLPEVAPGFYLAHAEAHPEWVEENRGATHAHHDITSDDTATIEDIRNRLV